MWRGRGRGNFGLVLLVLELLQFGTNRIPPVTLGTIAFNVAMFLGIVHPFLNRKYPHPLDVCVGVKQVWPTGEYWRIIEATFHHADDMHLYFNMVSFLWKARTLERRLGSGKFLYMLGLFTVLVNTVLLYLNYLIAVLFQDPSYLEQCAVGFSGVVFAVKVVTTQLLPRGTSLVMGFIPINTRWSCWLELILIQILVPNASFTGHLAGILVGLAFTQTPLKAVLNWPFPDNERELYGPSYTYDSGTTARNTQPYSSARADSFTRFTGGVSEDDQMRYAMEESIHDQQNRRTRNMYPDLNEAGPQPSASPEENGHGPPSYGWNVPPGQPDLDELRRRRLERLGNSAR